MMYGPEKKTIISQFFSFWRNDCILLRLKHVFRVFFFCFISFFVVFLFPEGFKNSASQQIKFKSSDLSIVTKYDYYTFKVEIAKTFAERQHGLMGRKVLPHNHGMLFDFGYPQLIRMWMKNTLLTLDMIFIDEKGIIIKVVSNTRPFSLKTITSSKLAQAVLEVNGGTALRLQISEGDKVLHSIFQKS